MKHNRKIIYVAGFLFSIPIALTSYINSSFLKTYVDEYSISIIYIVASIITILGMFEMPRILARIGNRLTTLFFSLLIFLSLILLALVDNVFVAIPAFILYFLSANFIIASLDIFIEDFSKDTTIGSLRGFYLMVINLAWVVAQTISGSIIAESSYKGIYLFSAGFMFLVSLIFILYLHNFRDPEYKKVSIRKTLIEFIKDKHISKIYLINLILKFFFAWMIIYTPIYLHEYMGFDWKNIGLIFTIMLTPFVFLSYPLGKLSDKIGEKKMLITGFLISMVFTLIIPFIDEPKILLWAFVLFATRVGAATVEVMSESYFFKCVNEENADAISFFRNTSPLSYIIAPLVAIPVFLLIPSFEFLYFILGGILFLGFLATLRLEDKK